MGYLSWFELLFQEGLALQLPFLIPIQQTHLNT